MILLTKYVNSSTMYMMKKLIYFIIFYQQHKDSRRIVMSKTFYPAGYVLTGEYEDKHIYKETRESFMIVSGDLNDKIVTDSVFATAYRNLKSISRDTIKCYEDISSAHHGPNLSSVAKGAFWFGAAGALVSAAVSQSNTYDIALEFKDGDKILIRITSAAYYQEFKRIFFDFPTISQSVPPAIPSNTDQNLQGVPVSQSAPLLERAHIFLDDGDFAKADEYFEKVLDLEPKNGQAYLGKLLVDLKINEQAKLAKQATPNILTENPNFIKAQKYGDEQLVSQLDSYVRAIKREYENTPQYKYEKATELFANAVTSDDFLKAASAFEKIPDYIDAHSYIEKCHDAYAEAKYLEATKLFTNAVTPDDFLKAASAFEKIPDYMDAHSYIEKCHDAYAEAKYLEAINLMNDAQSPSDFEKAAQIFASIKTYEDAANWIDICSQKAAQLKENAQNEEKLALAQRYMYSSNPDDLKIAIKYLQSLGGYRNADQMCEKCEKRLIELKEKAAAKKLIELQEKEAAKKRIELQEKEATKQLKSATTEEELLKSVKLFDEIGKKIKIVTVSAYDSNELSQKAHVALDVDPSAPIQFVIIDNGSKGFLGLGKKPIVAKAFIV